MTTPPSPAPDVPARIAALARQVQANADIADARHAADLPLCVFLLQMREYYRWEKGLGFAAPIERAAIGQWLAQRERQWCELEDATYSALHWADRAYDPLDADALNRDLRPTGWAYVAAWDHARRPLFALAKLQRAEAEESGRPDLLECGTEVARGVMAPPAALVGERTILLRRDALSRWLWGHLEVAQQHQRQGPWRTLVEAFGAHDAKEFEAVQGRFVEAMLPMLEWHERGEHRLALRLEPGWGAMRSALCRHPVDAIVRALRDLIVDLETTLPMLLTHRHDLALHGWFALLEGWRERLCPTLRGAYAAWCAGDQGQQLRELALAARPHFEALAEDLLALHACCGDESAAVRIARRLEQRDVVFGAHTFGSFRWTNPGHVPTLNWKETRR